MLMDEETGRPISLAEHAALLVADGRIKGDAAKAFLDAYRPRNATAIVQASVDATPALTRDEKLAAAKAALYSFTTSGDIKTLYGRKVHSGHMNLDDVFAPIDAAEPKNRSISQRAMVSARDVLCNMMANEAHPSIEFACGQATQILMRIPDLTYKQASIQNDAKNLVNSLKRAVAGPATGQAR